MALARLIWPVGKCRPAVRGFSASNLRSTMRLKAMAQVRAHTIAARISPKVRHPGQPRLSRAATAMAARAKGRAKMVWEKRTKDAHLTNKVFNHLHPSIVAPDYWEDPSDPTPFRPRCPRVAPRWQAWCKSLDWPAGLSLRQE